MSIVSVEFDPEQLVEGDFDRKFDTKKDTTSDFDEEYGTKMNKLIAKIHSIAGRSMVNNKKINDHDFFYRLSKNELIKYKNKRFHYYALFDRISSFVSFSYLSGSSTDKHFIYSHFYPHPIPSA